MNICFIIFLYLGFFELSTPAIASNLVDVETIDTKTNEMKSLVPLLKEHQVDLAKTAIFFDFDETLVHSVVNTFDGKTFKLFSSPDRYRTYAEIFQAVVSPSQMQEVESVLKAGTSHYELLDSETPSVIQMLKEEGAFVAVCSALQATYKKAHIQRQLQIDHYVFGGGVFGKAGAINSFFETHALDRSLSTVILVDNSEQYALKKFREHMTQFAPLLPQTRELEGQKIKVMSVEFTKFQEMLTPEAIMDEYRQLR